MKIDAKTFQELITTLEQQGDVTIVSQSTTGRPQRIYQLVGAEQAGEGTG
jgi:predicted ArsR family transcriptional regulator